MPSLWGSLVTDIQTPDYLSTLQAITRALSLKEAKRLARKALQRHGYYADAGELPESLEDIGLAMLREAGLEPCEDTPCSRPQVQPRVCGTKVCQCCPGCRAVCLVRRGMGPESLEEVGKAIASDQGVSRAEVFKQARQPGTNHERLLAALGVETTYGIEGAEGPKLKPFEVSDLEGLEVTHVAFTSDLEGAREDFNAWCDAHGLPRAYGDTTDDQDTETPPAASQGLSGANEGEPNA